MADQQKSHLRPRGTMVAMLSGMSNETIPTVQTVLRLPPALHRALKIEAATRGIPLNRLIQERLAASTPEVQS